MSSHPAPAEPETPPSPHATDAQYYRHILHDLIDLGADLARRVHHAATHQPDAALETASETAPASAPEPPALPLPEAAAAFERVTRAVRRTILLARTLAEPAQPVATVSPAQRTAARKRILREVEDTIQRSAEGARADTLQAEFLDRLDSPDLEDEIAHRPVAGIIADICRDLGLAAQPGPRPWKRRTPEDIAALCARAAGATPPPPRAAQPRAPIAGITTARLPDTWPSDIRPPETRPPGIAHSTADPPPIPPGDQPGATLMDCTRLFRRH